MHFRLLTLCLLTLGVLAPHARAQSDLQPRYGAGFEAGIFLGNERVVRDGFGLGIRARASFPVNADLSVSADAGVIGFVLSGRDGALYLFNPQVGGILTFPALGPSRYLIAGLGWQIPFSDAQALAQGGPTIHGGMGWVVPLRESSLYIEFNPALVIGESKTSLSIPVRIGVIF